MSDIRCFQSIGNWLVMITISPWGERIIIDHYSRLRVSERQESIAVDFTFKSWGESCNTARRRRQRITWSKSNNSVRSLHFNCSFEDSPFFPEDETSKGNFTAKLTAMVDFWRAVKLKLFLIICFVEIFQVSETQLYCWNNLYRQEYVALSISSLVPKPMKIMFCYNVNYFKN